MQCILTLCIVFLCTHHVSRAEIFEFEDALNKTQQGSASWRSNASNNKTLRLLDPTAKLWTIHLTLCVEPANRKPNVSMRIENVRYSNDGGPDSVIFRLQGNYLSHFNTDPVWNQYGDGWNMFKNSGVVGQGVYLKRGQYNLTIASLTSPHGVELDTLNIRTRNQHPALGLVCKKRFEKH